VKRLATIGSMLSVLASHAGAQTPASVAVVGVVQDQTGGLLAAATVELVNGAGAIVRTTQADAAGAFRFEGVTPGQYELRARYEGFNSATARVRVGVRAPSAQRFVLGLADIRQEITVSNAATEVSTDSMQYTLSRADNDTNGIVWFPANDYDSAGEWARADFDRRHRFLLLGRVSPGSFVDLGVGLSINSAGPYTVTLGQDVHNNGRGRARPAGVPRNSLEGDGYAQLDLRASRDVKLGQRGQTVPTMTLAVDVFNALNRVNYATYVGTIGSPLFGMPVTARAPRQLQFSARVKF
jgi:hypothetical protein